MGEDVLAALGLKSQEKLGWCSSTYSAVYDCRRVVPAKDCALRFLFIILSLYIETTTTTTTTTTTITTTITTNRTRGWGGNSVKSALQHKLKMDTRDNALAPTKGNYFELSSVCLFIFYFSFSYFFFLFSFFFFFLFIYLFPSLTTPPLLFPQELAGLAGDVAFFKSQVSCQSHVPLPFGAVLLSFLSFSLSFSLPSFSLFFSIFLSLSLSLSFFLPPTPLSFSPPPPSPGPQFCCPWRSYLPSRWTSLSLC